MKLLIVVDKLLTGFDAPPATYLYIDKKMQDHGLFQAICRVNRLDGEDKVRLHHRLQGPVQAAGRRGARLHQRRTRRLRRRRREGPAGRTDWPRPGEDLEEAREAVKALCEPVSSPGIRCLHAFFCAVESRQRRAAQGQRAQRLKLYKLTAALLRAYAALASELKRGGLHGRRRSQTIKTEVDHFTKVRDEVKLASGDYIDLKRSSRRCGT
jgi:type I restriction enzyme R subunit